MRPNQLIARAYLSRGAKIWTVSRLAVSGVFAFAGENPLRPSAAVSAGIVGLSVAMAFVQTRRESALLGNLAVSPQAIGACFLAPALLGEALLRVVAALGR